MMAVSPLRRSWPRRCAKLWTGQPCRGRAAPENGPAPPWRASSLMGDGEAPPEGHLHLRGGHDTPVFRIAFTGAARRGPLRGGTNTRGRSAGVVSWRRFSPERENPVLV